MAKMNLSSSDGQATSVKNLAGSRMNAYQTTMEALIDFIGTDSLKGNAYSNAKAYAESTLLPLLQAAILYEEDLSEAVGKIPSEYRNTEHLGDEDLDSVVLEEELYSIDMSRNSLMESIATTSSTLIDFPERARDIQTMRGQLQSLSTRREKIINQLTALSEYDTRSTTFFAGLTDIQAKLDSGIGMISTDMSNFTGSFPQRHSIEWAGEVKKRWKKREERIAEADFEKVAEELSKKKGISLEEAFNWILSGEEKVDGLGDLKDFTSSVITFTKEKVFINGRAITINAGRVKIGNKFLYRKTNGHIYRNTSRQYKQAVGEALDIESTNIGKGVGLTGFKGALPDMWKSAKSTFKSSLNVFDDFNWKNASELTKLGKVGKGLGMVGTVLNVGGNIKENFFDDKTTSVGEKIRNFVVDQGVDTITDAGAAATGAAIGTFIGGPIGTVIGAGVGIGISWALDQKIGDKSAKDWVKDGLKGATDFVAGLFG